jgi:hypothetical protein
VPAAGFRRPLASLWTCLHRLSRREKSEPLRPIGARSHLLSEPVGLKNVRVTAWRGSIATAYGPFIVCKSAPGRARRVTIIARGIMEHQTLLIIIVIILLVGGGGWYGRGRWY